MTFVRYFFILTFFNKIDGGNSLLLSSDDRHYDESIRYDTSVNRLTTTHQFAYA
jgi:hypothetical protein